MIVSDRRRRPRALTAVAVLVCLIIVTLVAGAVLKVALSQRDQTRAAEQRLQAEWLAEAGIQRALARLAAEPGYTGETWEIPPRDLDSVDGAQVAITVARAPGDGRKRDVRVHADYPLDAPRRARHSKQVVVETQAGVGTNG
jgi:type II secretory pathway pseudopilin PulG